MKDDNEYLTFKVILGSFGELVTFFCENVIFKMLVPLHL